MSVTLQTDRLTLRPLSDNDLSTVYAYAADSENTAYMLHLPSRSPADTARFLAAVEREWRKECPGFYEFAILLGETHIGAVSVSLDETRQTGELGWILRKAHWGHGYATEAARAVAAFAFQTLRCDTLTACCDKRNAPSLRVMENLGMVLSEKRARTYLQTGETAQELWFSLSKGTFNAEG